MPVVKLEPTDQVPLPYSVEDETLDTFLDEMTVAANTADVLEALGAPVEVDTHNFEQEKALIDAVVRKQETAPLKHYPTALAASSFVRTYGRNLAHDVMEVRAALTNKLLEIADCGEIKFELKAIEMLGKHSDIGLFTDRSEITINYNSPEALEKAIRERVKRLLNADVIEHPSLGMDLDEELGVYARPDEEEEDEEEVEGETEE